HTTLFRSVRPEGADSKGGESDREDRGGSGASTASHGKASPFLWAVRGRIPLRHTACRHVFRIQQWADTGKFARYPRRPISDVHRVATFPFLTVRRHLSNRCKIITGGSVRP